MTDISIFCDESGSENGHSRYCLVTLVFHIQDEPIATLVSSYKQALHQAGLAVVPFHTSPCMNGHGDFEGTEVEARKNYLMHFFMLQRKLPYRYKTFIYKRKEIPEPNQFISRFSRDLASFLADNLERLQAFEHIKLYYDEGQNMVTKALREAFSDILGSQSVIYRKIDSKEYSMFQVADFICTLELTAIKFENNETTQTDEKFFGTSKAKFKKLFLRHIRKEQL